MGNERVMREREWWVRCRTGGFALKAPPFGVPDFLPPTLLRLPTQDLKTTLGLCMPYLSACRGDDRVGGRDDVKRLRAAVVKGARERRIVCRDGSDGGEEEQQHREQHFNPNF